MPQIIIRVCTKYGIRDYHTLKQAMSTAKPDDDIQIVAPDGLHILSRHSYRNARPSWVRRTLIKYGYEEVY